jgi:hypothetical protein
MTLPAGTQPCHRPAGPATKMAPLYVGVHTLVINYRNQAGRLVNEVLVFDGALVAQGHGTYLVRGAGQAIMPTPAGH